jgi:hypothetical protein
MKSKSQSKSKSKSKSPPPATEHGTRNTSKPLRKPHRYSNRNT